MKLKLRLRLPFIEELFYLLSCLTTFGVTWIIKIIIKKAIIEANEQIKGAN